MPIKDPEKKKEYNRKWKVRRRNAWLLANGPCKKCGSTIQLEVDHVDRKNKVTSNVWSWSTSRQAEELKKCQVLCRKCHRLKTNTEISKPMIHGTRGAYKKGCRCRMCKDISSKYMREFRAKIKVRGLDY